RNAMAVKPDSAQYHGNVLYTMHFHGAFTPRQILDEHRRWGERFARPLAAANAPFPNDCSKDRKLRIGYVSPDFRQHPVGRFLLPLFRHHDHSAFEIFCFSGVQAPDELTARLSALADHWRETASMSDT